MPSIEQEVDVMVEVEFEVYCKKCGAGLCNNTEVESGRYAKVYIIPCEECLDKAKNDGFEGGEMFTAQRMQEEVDEAFERGRASMVEN